MLFKKIIGVLLVSSFSLPYLALAQDLSPESQNFTLTYSERTDIGDDLDQIIANMETLAMKEAEQKCNGAAVRLNMLPHYYHGPWSYTAISITFEFNCVANRKAYSEN